MGSFSVIFALWRVILLRSDIRLKPSDIALRQLRGEYNITETVGFNITFATRKYHSVRYHRISLNIGWVQNP